MFYTLSSSFTSQQKPVSNKLPAILKVQNGGQLKAYLAPPGGKMGIGRYIKPSLWNYSIWQMAFCMKA